MIMYIEQAIGVLLSNKVRSLLTILGLIIGVGAVIAIQVLGKSMAGAVGGALSNVSDTSFLIFPTVIQGDVSRAAIRLSDLKQIANQIPEITQAIPIAGRNGIVRAGHNHGRYFLSAEGDPPFNRAPILYGRGISSTDVDGSANVAVISYRSYQKLFPDGGDPTGQSLHIGAYRYVVIGVHEEPKNGFLNAQFSGDIQIPYTTIVRQYVHGGTVLAARFVVTDPSQIGPVETQVITLLKHLHRGASGVQYQAIDKAQITQGINGIFNALTIVVGLIGAVSMLVAGIGIMNIMLVSVTERTREIGVRKAIGARRDQILLQFFIEALILCGAGCGIGLAIGLGIGAFVNAVAIVKLSGYVEPLPWLQAALITLAFTIIVTLAFGTYPAYRASRLDPIEALRYE